MRTHCTVVSVTLRSSSIDGSATFTIATSSTVMKNAAPTIASVSQRRLWFIRVFYLMQLSCRRSRGHTSGVNGRGHRIGVALLAAVVAGTVAAAGGQARRVEVASCPPLPHDYAYDSAVQAALSSRSDLWGNQLLNMPGGPTYAAARRFLHPLMLVGPPAGKDPHPLTDSGIYYLPFGPPARRRGRTRTGSPTRASTASPSAGRTTTPARASSTCTWPTAARSFLGACAGRASRWTSACAQASATAPVSRASPPRSWAAATCRS